MSTDAWIEEHWIGEAVLLRSRRAPKLPALPVSHAPTCSCGNAALAAHAQSRDSARHPGERLSARQESRNVADQQARKLTQPSGRSPRVLGKARSGPVDVAHGVSRTDVTSDMNPFCNTTIGSGSEAARDSTSCSKRASRAATDMPWP